MKFTKIILALGLLFSFAKADGQFIPRVGLGLGSHYAWGYDTGIYNEDDTMVVAGRLGLLYATESYFVDLGFEGYSYDSSTYGFVVNGVIVDHTQTEMSLTGGINFYKQMYFIAGYKTTYFGDGYFNDDYATQSGPFIGLSINNLTMGNDRQDIFSYSLAYQFIGDMSYNSAASAVGSEDSTGINMKFTYRRAGSNFSYDLKYQLTESDDVLMSYSILMLGVNYNFTNLF